MNNGINADNIAVARRQWPSEPKMATTTGSLNPELTEREPSRSADGSSTARRDGRGATVSWYGKLLIVSMLVMGAAWEVFKWIIAVITLD